MDTKREHRTHAEGSPRGNPYDLTYSPSGRLIGKFRDNNSVTLSATVDMAYGYCDDYQPHAAKRMFEFTGKENDCETDYSYFGARYYDPTLLTSWTAVDPMADKYPNTSPYAYCAWNPMKLVDPDGRDWYMNENTGTVYYNSEIHGERAAGVGAMKGEGWMYLGANGMFGKSDISLIGEYNGRIGKKTNDVFDISGESGIHITGEKMFNDKEALLFMKSQGYKLVATQTITYENTWSESYQTLPGHTNVFDYGDIIDYPEKVGYVPNNYVEIGRTQIGPSLYGEYNIFRNNTPSVSRNAISYGSPSFLSKIGNVWKCLSGRIDYINHSVGSFSQRNTLVEKFLRL